MSDTEAARHPVPQAGHARVHILQDGYAREEAAGDRVGSTITLITEGDVAVIVDPGMVSEPARRPRRT